MCCNSEPLTATVVHSSTTPSTPPRNLRLISTPPTRPAPLPTNTDNQTVTPTIQIVMSTNHTIMSANQPVTSTSTSETETTLNSAITPHSIPINQEILSNPNLFLKHISDVDQDLLHFPNPSPPSINTQNPSTKIHISDSKPSFYPPKSTNPQKECPTLKLSHSTKNPNMLGAQILIKNPTILNTMNTLGL